jgi:uroporphyrinogen-III synthase
MALEAELEARGFKTFIEPMLSIENIEVTLPDLLPYSGLVFTSANAVRAFSSLTDEREKNIYVVGNETAKVADSLGWKNIKSANGDSAALKTLLEKNGLHARELLHLSGEHIAEPLTIGGDDIERLIVYRAIKASELSEGCQRLIDKQLFEAVMFFSPRSASAFKRLLEKHGCIDNVSSINVLCISDSVVECVRDVTWGGIYVSKTPDRSSMLGLLEETVK